MSQLIDIFEKAGTKKSKKARKSKKDIRAIYSKKTQKNIKRQSNLHQDQSNDESVEQIKEKSVENVNNKENKFLNILESAMLSPKNELRFDALENESFNFNFNNNKEFNNNNNKNVVNSDNENKDKNRLISSLIEEKTEEESNFENQIATPKYGRHMFSFHSKHPNSVHNSNIESPSRRQSRLVTMENIQETKEEQNFELQNIKSKEKNNKFELKHDKNIDFNLNSFDKKEHNRLDYNKENNSEFKHKEDQNQLSKNIVNSSNFKTLGIKNTDDIKFNKIDTKANKINLISITKENLEIIKDEKSKSENGDFECNNSFSIENNKFISNIINLQGHKGKISMKDDINYNKFMIQNSNISNGRDQNLKDNFSLQNINDEFNSNNLNNNNNISENIKFNFHHRTISHDLNTNNDYINGSRSINNRNRTIEHNLTSSTNYNKNNYTTNSIDYNSNNNYLQTATNREIESYSNLKSLTPNKKPIVSYAEKMKNKNKILEQSIKQNNKINKLNNNDKEDFQINLNYIEKMKKYDIKPKTGNNFNSNNYNTNREDNNDNDLEVKDNEVNINHNYMNVHHYAVLQDAKKGNVNLINKNKVTDKSQVVYNK